MLSFIAIVICNPTPPKHSFALEPLGLDRQLLFLVHTAKMCISGAITFCQNGKPASKIGN